jgi:hemoglobin/transferrin/lactoferrin receptor protein
MSAIIRRRAPACHFSRAVLLSSAAFCGLGLTPGLAQVVVETETETLVAQEGETTVVATETTETATDIAGAFTRLGRIVFGTGTPRVAIDTPQAVTVLDREDLDRENANTLDEVFQGVPGVQATGASARVAGQAINIRGIGNAEQTASESRIIVTVDGAPKFFEQYRMGSFFGDIELYERVEVLRGPASSTLYGSGAIGGVVNFTTKDAADFIEPGRNGALRFKAGFESNGEGSLASVIYATRLGDYGDFLAAINYSQSGDIEDGDGGIIPGTAFQQTSGLLKGRYFFGDNQDQSIELSYSRTDSDLDDTVVAQTGGSTVTSFGTADMDTVDDTAVLTYNYSPIDNPLIDLDISLSHSYTSVDKSDFSLGVMCASGTLQVLCENDASYETNTIRVENTSDLSTGAWENYLTLGIQGAFQERKATSSLGALAFHPEGTDDRVAIYAQGELTWNEKLTLIPGLRVEQVDQKPGAAAAAAGGEPTDGTAVSPKLAALYQMNDNWGVFGSLARTERMPTLDELYSSEPAIRRGNTYISARTPSLNLENEIATTFELGLTFQDEGFFTADDVIAVKLTGFNNDIDNLITTTTRLTGIGPQTPVPYYSNINQARIWGAEIEGSYDSEFWFGNLAYSNVKSENKATGQTLVDTPAENVALTIGGKLPNYNLVVGWTGMYFDEINTSSVVTSAPSYDVHNIFVTWTPETGPLEGLAVNFSIENIFDTTYRNNLELDNSPGRTFKIALAKSLDW